VLGRLHSEEEKPLVRAMKHGLKEIIKNLHFISPTELLVIGEYGGIEYVRFSTDSKPFAILNHTVLRGRGDREKAHAYLYLNKNLFLSGAGHYGVTHTEFTSSGGLKFTAFSRDPEDATGDIQTVTALESIDQGRWIMMGSRNGFIQIYDTSKLYLDGKYWRTKGEPILAWNARVRPSANEQFPVKMWDYMFGSPARRPDMVRHPIAQLMVFPEKNKVLAVSIDALDGIGYGYRALSGVRFTLFNFSSGALIRTWRSSTEMHELELHPMEVPVQRSPDGRQLFVGSLTTDGKLTDIQTFDVESLLTDEPTKAVDFSKN
jgi:WD40 repeat protein